MGKYTEVETSHLHLNDLDLKARTMHRVREGSVTH
jgi:hypothetical protein